MFPTMASRDRSRILLSAPRASRLPTPTSARDPAETKMRTSEHPALSSTTSASSASTMSEQQQHAQSNKRSRRRRITSMLSNLRGRQVIFTSWITTRPFVSSFVEDERKGTAKQTRENTLVNRSQENLEKSTKTTLSYHSSHQKQLPESVKSYSSSDLDRMDTLPKREISFSNLARVYTDLTDEPTLEQVKTSNPLPTLEARRRSCHFRCPKAQCDPNAPTTSVGKWLLQNKQS